MSPEKPYRLVWFQHFHKAAGSAVISAAWKNKEKVYPQARNGNPLDKNGVEIPIWTYDAQAQKEFVDHCEALGVTFIASEWGCQDFVALRDDPRVVSITFIRDPWSRLVSNYKYDVLRRFCKLTPLQDYYFHPSLPYRQPNYYTRALAIGRGVCKGTSAQIMQTAIENFSAIDFRANLHQPAPFQAMCDFLGWENFNLVTNKTPSLLSGTISAATRGDFGFMRRKLRLQSDAWTRVNAFKEIFDHKNQMDNDFFNTLGTTSSD